MNNYLSAVALIDADNEEVLWTGTPEDLVADNDGDPEIVAALFALQAGRDEVPLGGGAIPMMLLRLDSRLEPT